MNNKSSFLSRQHHFQLFRLGAVLLLAVSWASSACADEKSADQPEYHLISDVDYEVRVRTIAEDAYGNASADGVVLAFDGQPVQLVNGKITKTG